MGVYKAWPHYEKLAKKMVRSKRRVDIEKDVTLLELMRVVSIRKVVLLFECFIVIYAILHNLRAGLLALLTYIALN